MFLFLVALLFSTPLLSLSPRLERPSRFFSIPVVYDESGKPYIQCEIKGRRFSLLFDLGAMAEVTLTKDLLNQLQLKRVSSESYKDLLGYRYEMATYLLEQFAIGKRKWKHLLIMQLPEDFKEKSRIEIMPKSSAVESDQVDEMGRGLVGWELFKKESLLLDFSQNRIVLSPEKSRQMHPVSISLEKGIVIAVETDIGVRRFFLDTGSPVNIVRPGIFRKSRSQLFKIGKRDYGPFDFISASIDPYLPFDGILGMPFFQSHRVLLDFRGKKLYISRTF